MIVDHNQIGRRGYVLYKIDLLHYLLHNNVDNNLTSLCSLLFSLVFDNQHHYFNYIKLESKFYFFGLDFCDTGGFVDDYNDESFSNVYTLEEMDLICIKPSDHNNGKNFKHLFTRIDNPMHSPFYIIPFFLFPIKNCMLYLITILEIPKSFYITELN